MHRYFFLIFFALCCHSFILKADSQKFYFRHLGLKDNLSQSSVLCIVQDRKGFMWFGTKDGLNRYDGSEFRNFIYNRNDTASLGNNVINALYENKDGKLWVGTDNGIYLYNPQKETFSRFKQTSQDGTIIEQPVVQISSDSKDNVWIAVKCQGIFCYNHQTNLLLHYPLPDSCQINSFCIDQQDAIWIGYTSKGLFYTEDSFKSLKQFLTETGENIFSDDPIFKILPENHNTLYVGSAKGGLQHLNILTRKVTNALPNEKNVFVRNIYPADEKNLWIATEQGIYIYNKETRKSKHIVHNPNDIYSISNNAIYSIYKDRENGIWIGSYFGGIDYYQDNYSKFEKHYPITGQESLSGKVVREFLEDASGNIWIGTEDGGLNIFNPKTRQTHPFLTHRLHYNIHGLCTDGKKLWIGTHTKGLYSLDLKTGHLRNYLMQHTENSLNSNSVYSIYHTSAGTLYIGTPAGLNIYHSDTDSFRRIHELDGNFIFSILEDKKGNIWFGTENTGIFKYNPRNKEWKHYTASPDNPHALPCNKITNIYEDSKQRLWFATQGRGFCLFNPEKEEFLTYDSSKGLPNDVIYKIIEDDEGMLWMTSNKGLIRFDPHAQTFVTYLENNGLLTNQFNYSSGLKDKNGTIYFGCIKGFIAFKPENLTENTVHPTIAFTDFMLFNKKVKANEKDSPLRKSITYTDNLTLKHNQNSFSLHFTTLCYSTLKEYRLQYKLEGFDKEWYNASANALATYTNLKPGDYTFCIKVADGKGEWSDDTTQIQIHIMPPFWKSLQAYLLYFLLVVGLAGYMFYHSHKRIVRRHKRQMEKLESEKQKEIYQAKIDFFTNIAHEIRTPLTLIKGPLDNILKEKEPNKKLLQDNLEVMKRNTLRLLDLINQLLDFRKTETQGFQLDFMECNISQLIKDTYIRFNPAAQQNGLTFTTELPEKDFYASVNREAVTKILSNLFNNAIKYGTSYIHVSLMPQAGDKEDTFLISVSNGGNPIPKDMQEKIFEPFVQIKNTEKETAGSGIGLPLARSLAEMHAGKLYLKKGNEICFCVELPVKQEKTIRLQKENTEVAAARPGISQHKTDIRILIVEDDMEMQDFICKQISGTYEVLKACNGKEALQLLNEENDISLIVSDVMMPEMDGFELCRTLKTNIEYSHIPIILLTAKTTMQSKIQGIELGANDYIEKPFSTEYLLVRIANLLSNQDKLRQAFTSSPFVKAKTIALSKADEEFLDKLTETIQKNISEPDFNIDVLAEKMFMSRSSLHRKIKGIAQITPNEFIQLERLKTAARLIQSKEYRINEVCYLVGFSSPSYFAKCFQKQFGTLPKNFK